MRLEAAQFHCQRVEVGERQSEGSRGPVLISYQIFQCTHRLELVKMNSEQGSFVRELSGGCERQITYINKHSLNLGQ